MNRSRLLILLFVLLLGALWYAWQATPRQQRVSGTRPSNQASAVVAAGQGESVGVVGLDFSGGDKLEYQKPLRDLFRPLYPAPVITKQPPPPSPPVVRAPPPPPPPQPRPVVVPPTGPEPIPPLNVLGFLQNGQQTTVFLASRQGDLYLVKKGERFADNLLVRELDASKITISRGQHDAGVTLNIGEKKNQRMAIPKLQSGRPSIPVINLNIPDTEPPTEPATPPAGGEEK